MLAKRKSIMLTGLLVFYLTISPLSIYSSPLMEVLGYIFLICMLYRLSLVPDYKSQSFRKSLSVVLFLLIIAFIIPALVHLELPFATDFLQWIFILCLFLINNFARSEVLKVAINAFCVVLLLSLIEYLLGYIYGISYTVNSFVRDSIPFVQTPFNLYRYGDLTYRFTALCNEPGALGAVCGFVISFLPFQRKYFLHISICIISGILSLSLAFFIYMAFVICFKLLTGKLPVKYIAILCVVGVMAGMFFKEQISKAIFLRVTETEQLDNRGDQVVNNFVENIFSSDHAIFGFGNRTAYKTHVNTEVGNAGFKWKLYQYGLCGVFFYFLAMLLLYKKHRNKNVSYYFGVIFYLLYFYSVGNWGVPFFLFLMFTTLYDKKNELNRSI